jgi:hypothetical protein
VIAGGAVILAAVLGLRVVPWAVSNALAAQHSLEQQARLLARTRAELNALPSLRDSAAVLTRALVGLAPRLLDGANDVEAGADLAARLNHAANRAPARLDRVEPLPDTATAGRLARARVRAALETDVRGLVSLLRTLETGDALLGIERLEVVSADPATPERRPEILRVEIIVVGWYLTNREEGRGNGEG